MKRLLPRSTAVRWNAKLVHIKYPTIFILNQRHKPLLSPCFNLLMLRTLRHHFYRLHTITRDLAIRIMGLMIDHEFHAQASN